MISEVEREMLCLWVQCTLKRYRGASVVLSSSVLSVVVASRHSSGFYSGHTLCVSSPEGKGGTAPAHWLHLRGLCLLPCSGWWQGPLCVGAGFQVRLVQEACLEWKSPPRRCEASGSEPHPLSSWCPAAAAPASSPWLPGAPQRECVDGTVTLTYIRGKDGGVSRPCFSLVRY